MAAENGGMRCAVPPYACCCRKSPSNVLNPVEIELLYGNPILATSAQSYRVALCTRNLLIYDAHGEAKGLTA
jgi:hypothetical protein